MIALKYAVMYITAYIVLVWISASFLNEANWLFILFVLFAAEVFRIFVVHVISPGFEGRMVENFGGRSARAAERLKEYLRRRR